jgi:hypothetical protein
METKVQEREVEALVKRKKKKSHQEWCFLFCFFKRFYQVIYFCQGTDKRKNEIERLNILCNFSVSLLSLSLELQLSHTLFDLFIFL